MRPTTVFYNSGDRLMPRLPPRSWFHWGALAAVLAFAAEIATLFLADTVYLLEYLARSSGPERSQFSQDVLTADTMAELILSVVTATITTVLALVDSAIVLPPLILGVSLLVAFCLLRRLAEDVGSVTEPQPILQWFYFIPPQQCFLVAQMCALLGRNEIEAWNSANLPTPPKQYKMLWSYGNWIRMQCLLKPLPKGASRWLALLEDLAKGSDSAAAVTQQLNLADPSLTNAWRQWAAGQRGK